MKRSYNELELYAYRRYVVYNYYRHKIRGLYWYYKYQYYKKKAMASFLK